MAGIIKIGPYEVDAGVDQFGSSPLMRLGSRVAEGTAALPESVDDSRVRQLGYIKMVPSINNAGPLARSGRDP